MIILIARFSTIPNPQWPCIGDRVESSWSKICDPQNISRRLRYRSDTVARGSSNHPTVFFLGVAKLLKSRWTVALMRWSDRQGFTKTQKLEVHWNSWGMSVPFGEPSGAMNGEGWSKQTGKPAWPWSIELHCCALGRHSRCLHTLGSNSHQHLSRKSSTSVKTSDDKRPLFLLTAGSAFSGETLRTLKLGWNWMAWYLMPRMLETVA